MTNKLSIRLKNSWNYIFNNELLLSLVVGIVIVLFALAIGLYNNRVVPISTGALAHYTLEPNNPLKVLSEWDGPNYLRIASEGYTNAYQTNFFPLYPLLTRVVHKVVPSLLDSGLIVSWICFILAIFYYLKLSKLLFKLKTNLSALYALVFFVLFPTAIFLIASYDTALLAFLSLATIYYALKNRPLLAGVFCFFVTLSHPTGVFVAILMALILLENRKAKIYKIVCALVIGLLGIGTYAYYLKEHFNNAFAFIASQKSHGWLSYHLSLFIHHAHVIDIPMLILVILAVVYWWNKRRSFAVYSFLFLLIPIVGGNFGGYTRYCLIDFPIALMAYGYLKNRRSLYTLSIILTAVSWAYYVIQYLGGYTGG